MWGACLLMMLVRILSLALDSMRKCADLTLDVGSLIGRVGNLVRVSHWVLHTQVVVEAQP
jgi:hypothetical protein